MRAIDRTLLAALGFADKDKKDDRHTLACQYLGTSDVANAIFSGMLRKYIAQEESSEFPSVRFRGPQYETVISKGEGKFKTTIGFIDVQLEFLVPAKCIRSDAYPYYRSDLYSDWHEFTFSFEVKSNCVPTPDAIRQINLYREHMKRAGLWTLATAYPISTVDATMLRDSRIVHITLGDKFTEWCKTATNKPAQSNPETTF